MTLACLSGCQLPGHGADALMTSGGGAVPELVPLGQQPSLFDWRSQLGLSAGRHHPTRPPSDDVAVVTDLQAADVQVAAGRSLEKRGEVEQAMNAYREALRRDPRRADASWRLGVLHDQQGKYKDSAGYYRRAAAAMPDNADLHCDMGYSFYLQRFWSDAEANLRRAVELAPESRRAHNNLGLVLAHTGRWDDALTAFRKGSGGEADAHVNLAFVLTLECYWPEARSHYERALQADPNSSAARKGLDKLNSLLAKAEPVEPPQGDVRQARADGPTAEQALLAGTRRADDRLREAVAFNNLIWQGR